MYFGMKFIGVQRRHQHEDTRALARKCRATPWPPDFEFGRRVPRHRHHANEVLCWLAKTRDQGIPMLPGSSMRFRQELRPGGLQKCWNSHDTENWPCEYPKVLWNARCSMQPLETAAM